MTIQIRHGVFETNSSSTHSLTIAKDRKPEYEPVEPDALGVLVLDGGIFEQKWERFNDALTKANYCAVYAYGNQKQLNLLEEVLKTQTGATKVCSNFTTDWRAAECSYIDHQSLEARVADTAFSSAENLKRFIFSPKSWLFTGNDNSAPLPNLFDVNKIFRYKYELSLDGTSNIALFEKKPTPRQTQRMIQRLWQHCYTEDAQEDYATYFSFEEPSFDHFDAGYVEVYEWDYEEDLIKSTKRVNFSLTPIHRETIFDRLKKE